VVRDQVHDLDKQKPYQLIYVIEFVLLSCPWVAGWAGECGWRLSDVDVEVEVVFPGEVAEGG